MIEKRITRFFASKRNRLIAAISSGATLLLVIGIVVANPFADKAPKPSDIFWISSDFTQVPTSDATTDQVLDFTQDHGGFPSCLDSEELNRTMRTGKSWGAVSLTPVRDANSISTWNNFKLFQQVIQFEDEATAERVMKLASSADIGIVCMNDDARQVGYGAAMYPNTYRGGKYQDVGIYFDGFELGENGSDFTSDSKYLFQRRRNVIMISGYQVAHWGLGFTEHWVQSEELVAELTLVRSKFRNLNY